MSCRLESVVSTVSLALIHQHVDVLVNLFKTNVSLASQDGTNSTVLFFGNSIRDLDDARNYVETMCLESGGEKREHRISLSPNMYETLARRRNDITAAAPAHIVWCPDSNSLLLLGSDDCVRQTGLLLSQVAAASVRSDRGGGARKLVGRSFTPGCSVSSGSSINIADAKNLLLTAQLPPELTISSPGLASANGTGYGRFSGLTHHSPLGRAISDGVPACGNQGAPGQRERANSFKSRRKLESEDSSYDSDHENIASTRSLDPSLCHLSKSHDDISRTTSETLAAEFAEYVSVRHTLSSGGPLYNPHQVRRHASGPPMEASSSTTALPSSDAGETLAVKSGVESRENSPILIDKLESVQETPSDCDIDHHTLIQDPQYNSKVEFALKLGYTERLTQRALAKLGMRAGQNELLDELIRLQQCKLVDPQEILLKETHDLLSASIPASSSSSTTDAALAPAPAAPSSSKTPGPAKLSAESLHNLRPIVVDGSNVAMSHGNKETFSCRGIKLCVQWLQARGHKDITVFVPKWRKESSKPDTPIKDQHILNELEKERLLFFTPSRQVRGRRLVCHDDRYILNLAAETGAIVVSNDNYRELIMEKPDFKKVIEERILMYSFVNDRFMPPDDPLGRNGPSLDNFLRIRAVSAELPPPCPYGKKCTYGNKCKFYHVERGNAPHKSVTERLKEQSSKQIMEVRTRTHSRDSSPGETLARTKSMNLPLHRTESDITAFARNKQPLSRTRSSQPKVTVPVEPGLFHPDPSLYSLHPLVDPLYKSEVSKSKSVDMSGTRLLPDLRVSSVPIHGGEPDEGAWRGGPGLEHGIPPSHGLEHGMSQGCLARFGMTAPWPPAPPHYSMVPPPRPEPNHHKRLERQLTINPAFDPRINKSESVSPSSILSSAAMAFHRNNPPPPLGRAHVEGAPPHPDASHANVTRIASAPDSIRQWGSSHTNQTTPPVAVVEPVSSTTPSSCAPSMQRLSSTSDTQLNRSLSSPFSDNWNLSKFDTAVSPIFGGAGAPSSNIWSAPPTSPPRVETPPPAPSNLGPVGSRPPKVDRTPESRTKLHYHLSALFPEEHVEQVMSLMPNETNPQKLCAAIMKMYPS